MKKPFFSIIIPTFNQSHFLQSALKSVFNQTFKNFEIIVIDNYSTDLTSEVIREYKNKIIYKKIRNKGIIAKSRNIGIKLARGKWIAFLDSDDFWSKNKLKIIKNFIFNSKIDIICHSTWIIESEKKKIKLWSYGPYKKNFYKYLLKYGNKFSTSASLVKKNFLDKSKITFNEDRRFITSEDYSFFMNLAKLNAKICFIDKPLGYQRFHKNSASANKKKHLISTKLLLKHHVFNIQDFTLNKQKLWSEVKSFIEFKKILFNKKNKFFMFLIYFFNNPFFCIKYSMSLFIKKVKDYLIYHIYKRELEDLKKLYEKLGILAH